MREMLFLEPVFKKMIWGGNRMREEFGYEIPGEDTGEAWVVSAHQKGDCRIKNGIYKGTTLSSLWKEHRELFGNLEGEVFPLLVKIIDAKADLSIQVHPDDSYAKENENGALGKTECWYILDCDEGADIVVGHNAADKEELKTMIAEKRFLDLIKIRPVRKGDFFQIEPGTVHAIRRGTLILETQQNSDITYRLYDYDRLQAGKPRELHIEKSVDVISCPYEEKESIEKKETGRGYTHEELVSCPYYTVDKWEIAQSLELVQTHPFLIINVIGGNGVIDGSEVKKGDNLILPFGYGGCLLEGEMTVITSHI